MTEPASVMFAAKRTILFQKPPHERPGRDEVLLLRQPAHEEGEADTWRFPTVGELEHSSELEPWIDRAYIARVDAPFTPSAAGATDFQWVSRDLLAGCLPTVLHPQVLPAIRRFDGSLLDQILARVEAFADSNSSAGDSKMGTTISDLQRQVADLQRRVGPPVGDPKEFREAQVKADSAYRARGESAPPPLAGERILQYKTRLLGGVQHMSRRWKDKSLVGINDAVLAEIEAEVYRDAMSEAIRPTQIQSGQIRPIATPDASGRVITKYAGDPNACWDQFNPPIRHVRRFLTPAR